MSESARSQLIQRSPDEGEGAVHISHQRRVVRTAPPTWRWECPCQEPAVLLATYDPGGRMNIKVRDRYWHLFGFGQVQAICPRCAAEHILDLRFLQDAIASGADSRNG